MNHQNTNTNVAKSASCDSGQSMKPAVLAAHPIATGLGAVGVGAAVGATSEVLDPAVETTYWRETYSTRPYANSTQGYDEYAPAYKYGWESFGSKGSVGKTFESVEADLGRGWDKAKGASRLGWDKAKHATHDAWDRVMGAGKGGQCCGATTALSGKL